MTLRRNPVNFVTLGIFLTLRSFLFFLRPCMFCLLPESHNPPRFSTLPDPHPPTHLPSLLCLLLLGFPSWATIKEFFLRSKLEILKSHSVFFSATVLSAICHLRSNIWHMIFYFILIFDLWGDRIILLSVEVSSTFLLPGITFRYLTMK